MRLVHDLLDKQLHDRKGINIGKVDGLVFSLGSGPPRLIAIELGAATLARRSSFFRFLSRLWGAGSEGFRIPWSKVKAVATEVTVDIEASETALSGWHDRLRRRLLHRLPGS
jgi:sporulation protein YlmC with PRC-barrel domain